MLSNTDLAHAYYAKICQNTNTFQSLEDLVQQLKAYQHSGEYHSSIFAEKYVKEKVENLYLEVLKG